VGSTPSKIASYDAVEGEARKADVEVADEVELAD
jgi:hypothetical protein